MTMVKPLSDRVSVSPQLWPEQVADLARGGAVLLVNNRPDDEEPGQPTSAAIEAAARSAGLDYRHLPMRGLPSEDTVGAMIAALDASDGAVVAFCRSGMRSTMLWALAESARGGDPEAIRQAAWAAGYDLSGLPL